VEKAVKTSVPRGTEDLNLRAFRKGYEYGRQILSTSELEAPTTMRRG
jgi:Pyruvate/2-oxoacid:ferredoxin oxidoreductase gamma subunit